LVEIAIGAHTRTLVTDRHRGLFLAYSMEMEAGQGQIVGAQGGETPKG
jgi:hypothetical protein